MIDEITLKFGGSLNSEPLTLKSPKVTVFVGPNNSGKSQLLKDILAICQNGRTVNTVLIDNLNFSSYSQDELNDIITHNKRPIKNEENINPNHYYLNFSGKDHIAYQSHFNNALLKPNYDDNSSQQFATNFANFFTLNLSSANRVSLLNPQNRGDLKNPTTIFARLLTDDDKREAIRNKVFEAFRLHLAIDMSEGANLSMRFGKTSPPDERSVSAATLNWMKEALPIDRVSDGVLAFSGILTQLYSGDPKVLIVDEPEAFLHPALANKLGKEIAKTALDEQKQVFVSTHSSEFLMGCIQSGADVEIIRLTYRDGVGTARRLNNEQVKTFMQDPFLRSANVLSGLFHEHVIVTEADADRAFYQEINHRLLESVPSKGIPNALFLNSNGKDTLHRIAAPLRELGVPVATIADIDVLNEGGKNWSSHMKGYFLPITQHASLTNQRKSTWDTLIKTDKNPKKEGGINLLKGSEKEAAENLLDFLKTYGFFIVPTGEVEHWLQDLDVDRSKHAWLKTIFEKMGSDMTSAEYVKPQIGDVWEFIEEMKNWLTNQNRKGIPSE